MLPRTQYIGSEVLLTVPRRCFFCGSLLLFMCRVCHSFLSVSCSLVVTCLERALLYVMFSLVFFTFPCGVLGQVWYLIVSIPDIFLLINLDIECELNMMRNARFGPLTNYELLTSKVMTNLRDYYTFQSMTLTSDSRLRLFLSELISILKLSTMNPKAALSKKSLI